MSTFATLFVVLTLPRSNEALLSFAKSVLEHLKNNPHFPNPSYPLTQFEADIKAFEDAQVAATGTRARGTAKLRNAKRARVKQILRHYANDVQRVVELETSHDEAAAIAESALMSVRKPAKYDRPALRARNTGVSGTVQAEAKAVAQDAVYFWQYSLDQQSWVSLPESFKAKVLITGLTPARIYYFRFRATTRTKVLDFSQVVSLLVA